VDNLDHKWFLAFLKSDQHLDQQRKKSDKCLARAAFVSAQPKMITTNTFQLWKFVEMMDASLSVQRS